MLTSQAAFLAGLIGMTSQLVMMAGGMGLAKTDQAEEAPEDTRSASFVPAARRSGMPQTWVLRATVWFAAASMLTTILHELAHATTAYALGVRSILFSYLVDLDFTDPQRTSNLPAIIGAAGPTFCLALGIVSWWLFRRHRGSAAALPLLYLSAFGGSTFFGNLMSMSSIGDFSRVAIELQLPMAVRFGGTALGALGVAGIQFWLGRNLAHFVPFNVGRTAGVLGIAALPVLLGTAAVIVVNQPTPGAFLSARVGEAFFSLFAVIGAWLSRKESWDGRGLRGLHWTDGVAAMVIMFMVRLMTRGIPFTP